VTLSWGENYGTARQREYLIWGDSDSGGPSTFAPATFAPATFDLQSFGWRA